MSYCFVKGFEVYCEQYKAINKKGGEKIKKIILLTVLLVLAATAMPCHADWLSSGFTGGWDPYDFLGGSISPLSDPNLYAYEVWEVGADGQLYHYWRYLFPWPL